jgi:hypothetical protein
VADDIRERDIERITSDTLNEMGSRLNDIDRARAHACLYDLK